MRLENWQEMILESNRPDIKKLKKLNWVDWNTLVGPIYSRLIDCFLLYSWEGIISLIINIDSYAHPESLSERASIIQTSILFGFSLDFKDLPNHINHIDFIVKRIIQYRLEVGK